MALAKCKECNHTISQSAEACPNCGAKIKQTALFTKIVASIFMFIFVMAIFGEKNLHDINEHPNKIKFTDTDFTWDKKTSPYKQIIVAGVNKVIQENSRCETADPGTAYISSSKGSASDPVFYVTCTNGDDVFNAFFSKSEVEQDKMLAAIKHIDRSKAIDLCESYARSKSAHPSTFSFSRIMDLAVKEHANGRATIYSSFTVKNSFNLELKYNIRCLLDTSDLIEADISETV